MSLKALINVKGIKSGYVTDITKNNLSYCEEAMKIGELPHLEGIKGNFAISEKGAYGFCYLARSNR